MVTDIYHVDLHLDILMTPGVASNTDNPGNGHQLRRSHGLLLGMMVLCQPVASLMSYIVVVDCCICVLDTSIFLWFFVQKIATFVYSS